LPILPVIHYLLPIIQIRFGHGCLTLNLGYLPVPGKQDLQTGNESASFMKRCAILFAILIVTLILAVWSEHRTDKVSMKGVALEGGQPAIRTEMTDPLSR